MSLPIFHALGMFAALGAVTIAANALSNFAGTRVYDRREGDFGDFEFIYDSDDAQELREKLSEFPIVMMGLYLIFVILVIVFGWVAFSGRSQDNPDMSLLFVPLTSSIYITIIVCQTCMISKKLYRVFDDTQGN